MELKMSKQRGNIIFVSFIILAVVLNMITNKNSIIVDIYALLYGILILKIFKGDSFKDKIYFLTLLFAILSFSFLIKIKGRYDIYFYYISMLIYFFIMVKNYKDYNIKGIIKNKYFIFLFGFIVYIMISVLWSMNKGLAIKSIINYLIMICLLIVVIDYNSKSQNITKTIKYIYYMVIGIIPIGLIEMTGNRFNIRNHYIDENLYRLYPWFLKKIPTTFFYSPNDYGVFIVFAMVFLLIALVYTNSKKEKYIFGLVYLLLNLNLIFTTSRTAWISLFLVYVFILVLFLIYKRYGNLKKILFIGILTFVVFYTLSLIPVLGPFYGKFRGIAMPEYGETGSTNVRYTLIMNIIDGVIIKGNFLGFGVGNTSSYLKIINNTNGITNAHSLWFEILGDFGLPIFIAFGLIYLALMYDLFKVSLKKNLSKNYALSLLVCFFGFIFLSFAPSSVISFTPFWLLMGLGVSTIVNVKENKNENIDICKLVPKQKR